MKKTLSEANLAALGAERLAAILMENAGPALKRHLRLELAAAAGAPDLAFELDKRLGALEASNTRVSWRKRAEFISELQSLKRMIVERLGVMEPSLALDRLAAWFDLYPSVSRRVKDPKGELALAFDDAATDLAALASRVGPVGAAPVLSEALATRLSEWATWIGRGAAGLSPDLARRLLADLTHGKPRPTGRLALVVRKLADRAGDLDMWAFSIPDAERANPEMGAELARRLALANRAVEARAALERARSPATSGRWANFKTPAPMVQSDCWLAAEIAVLDAEDDAATADEARWSLFGRTLSADILKSLLQKLSDFEDVAALDRAFDIAATHVDAMRGLSFLMDWPAHREAAAMILARRAEMRGAHDAAPLWVGRLAARYPDAALILLRARATALVRLGGGVSEEVEGLISEAETLAAHVSDPDIVNHDAFLDEIRQTRPSALGRRR